MTNNNIKVFSLSGAKQFADQLKKRFKDKYGVIETLNFADGELMVKPTCSVRGLDVFLIQSICNPVNNNLMELLIAIDACKRASAKSINIIITYFGYSRQDRKSQPREPISFKLVADLLQVAGATRVLTFDIHASQTQGFFNIPFDSLEACWLLMTKFWKNTNLDNYCVVAPDYGSVKRARDISKFLNCDLVIIDKRRPKPNEVEIANVLGDCNNKNCIIVDDIIDTGGTMIESAKILKQKNAASISILATHAIFSKNAISNFTNAIKNNIITNLYVTNSIYHNFPSEINVVSLSDYLIEIIKRFENGYDSITDLVNKSKDELLTIINNGK